MASSSSSSAHESRIPRKRMIDSKSITAVDIVRSVGDRSLDKWCGNTAMDRIEADMGIYREIAGLILSLSKEDSEGEESSKRSKAFTSLLAYTVKQKFDNDAFLASKYTFKICFFTR